MGTALAEEAYLLLISKTGIVITASSYNGFLYGIQTLLQIIDQAEKDDRGIKLACVQITDGPSFKWRGMHLDVCCHFSDVDFIKKMLDAMAMHKLNAFHWHLTEDQGWRIEIEKYPLLTEISAWRDETVVGHMAGHPVKFDGVPYGGFYTKNEIRDVVEYAAKLGITVVPEIEMPGHAVAALLAYPQFSCTGNPQAFNERGVSHDVYCAGNDGTFEFLENILGEVIELFPGEYIHIGGDECPKTKWKQYPKCQKRINEEGLKDEHELQSYFIQRIERFINSNGRKLIGWDEILEGGLADNAAVMSWRGEQGGVEAAEMGHYVVMSPNEICYLDHYQSEQYEPLAIGGLTSMEDIYSWYPIPEGLDEDKHKYVLGAQGNVWTEYMPRSEHVEYMVFPRLSALSGVVWTKRDMLNYDDFVSRMNFHYNRLNAMDINYRVPYPGNIYPYNPVEHELEEISFDKEITESEIFYTTDGSIPDEKSNKYSNSFWFDLDEAVTIKAVTIMPSGRRSAVVSGIYEIADYRFPENEPEEIEGIRYKRYERMYTSAYDVSGFPDSEGEIALLKIPSGERSQFFGVEFSGWIDVPEDEIYTFHLYADDGAVLYIDGELVVDNDGFKYGGKKSGKIALYHGMHPFTIKYFQGKYGYGINLTYEYSDSGILEVFH